MAAEELGDLEVIRSVNDIAVSGRKALQSFLVDT